MKINPFFFGGMVLVIFLGIVVGFQQAGIWSTSGKVSGSGERIEPSAEDINTIKGWMTLEQVSTTFNVPMKEILSAFDLPASTPANTALKDLESSTFDMITLRTWLQERQQFLP